MTGDLGTIVAKFRKNAAETVIVRLVEFHGHPCVDVRVFVEGSDGQDVPTKKGVALAPSLIAALVAALQEAGAESERRSGNGEGAR